MIPRLLLLPVLCLAQTWALSAAEALHHIVVVFDGSGSMQGVMAGSGSSGQTKIRFAKQAVATVIADTPADHRVGLLVFGGGAPTNGWAYPLGPYDPGRFNAAIKPILATGGTPLGNFLHRGAAALLAARQKNGGYGTYRLLVLTDGEASDQKLVDRYLPEIIRRGIIIDVIGVDMKKDLALARNVHRYRRANDAAALQEALQEAFAEVGGSDGDDAAQDAAFELIAPLPDEVAFAAINALATPTNAAIAK